MNTDLYLAITNPEICRDDLRGIYRGAGWHFATNGFVGVFAPGDSDLPEAPNQKSVGRKVEKLLEFNNPVLTMIFNPDFLRTAIDAVDSGQPVTVSVFSLKKAGGHLVQFENEHGRSVVMSMRMTDNPPKWTAAK